MTEERRGGDLFVFTRTLRIERPRNQRVDIIRMIQPMAQQLGLARPARCNELDDARAVARPCVVE